MNKNKIEHNRQSGMAHYVVMIVFALIFALGLILFRVGDQNSGLANQNTEAARSYTYNRLSAGSERKIKKIAADYWSGSVPCAGKNGRNIRINYYSGALRLANIADKYDYSDALSTSTVDAIAYTYRSSETCHIYVNESVMKHKMDGGVGYTTLRSMCFTVVHEVGHLAGKSDIGYGQQHKVKDSTDYIMSYNWIDKMEDKSYRTGGPAGCQRYR